MKIIDPHLHLFNLELGDYLWLKADNPPFWTDKNTINKTFKEHDLVLSEPLTLAGFVHIEAGFDNNQPWRELVYLEAHCQKPFRTIATVDLTLDDATFSQQINKLKEYSSFVGVRHILDEQALSLLNKKKVQRNFQTLANYGLIFEVQMSLTEHAPVNSLCDIIVEHADINFIINHTGFPPADIQTIEWHRWQTNLVKLSAFPHVAIKCSGWEMTDRNYQQPWLNTNLALIFNIFGTKKMMLASNFPLCLFSKNSYQDYWHFITNSEFFQALSKQEKSALCYDNTLYWYF